MKDKIIAPSLLSARFECLRETVRQMETTPAGLWHLDIMDGHFVPNLTFGPLVVEAVKNLTGIPLDVHLMIENPGSYIERYAEAGASMISVHYEAVTHLQRVLRQIKDLGVKAGVALNPHTPVRVLENVLDDMDFVLIMSVNPGFSGQQFIPQTYKKLHQLREMLIRSQAGHIKVEIDGGVSPGNIVQLSEAGVDIFVSGSGIFNTPDPVATLREMYRRLH